MGAHLHWASHLNMSRRYTVDAVGYRVLVLSGHSIAALGREEGEGGGGETKCLVTPQYDSSLVKPPSWEVHTLAQWRKWPKWGIGSASVEKEPWEREVQKGGSENKKPVLLRQMRWKIGTVLLSDPETNYSGSTRFAAPKSGDAGRTAGE